MLEPLPDKFTPVDQTVVGQASELLVILGGGSCSVGQLFARHKEQRTTTTFDSFVDATTFLFAGGAVRYNDGIVGLA